MSLNNQRINHISIFDSKTDYFINRKLHVLQQHNPNPSGRQIIMYISLYLLKKRKTENPIAFQSEISYFRLGV